MRGAACLRNWSRAPDFHQGRGLWHIILYERAAGGGGKKGFDLRPSAIIRELNLRRPIYRQISNYGQLGREDVDISWEKTDRTGLLMAALK